MSKSEQARADAMADAETYLGILFDNGGERLRIDLRDERLNVWRAQNSGFASVVSYSLYPEPVRSAQFARLAARAAFRAVPGLRGDR